MGRKYYSNLSFDNNDIYNGDDKILIMDIDVHDKIQWNRSKDIIGTAVLNWEVSFIERLSCWQRCQPKGGSTVPIKWQYPTIIFLSYGQFKYLKTCPPNKNMGAFYALQIKIY
jgi:hypothetical protein